MVVFFWGGDMNTFIRQQARKTDRETEIYNER